ncbi:MAG: hypothetical protein JXM74_00095, partial [Fusobacteriaceae bacterium]|nr:hypothetical protein [Fusobacteriaceae bacterium]
MKRHNLNKYLLFVLIIFSLVACEKKTDGEKDLNVSKEKTSKEVKVEAFDEKKYEIKSEDDFKRNNNYAFEEAEKGNIDIAIKIMEFNLRNDSKNIMDYSSLIEYYNDKSKAGESKYLERTKKIYEKALKIYEAKKELTLSDKEDYSYLNFYMGNMQDSVDSFTKDEAFFYYEKIINNWCFDLKKTENQNLISMYKALADRYFFRGNYNTSYKMYKYLYELGKKDEDIVSLLGDCLVEKNQLKEAEKMYNEGMGLGQVDSIIGMTLLKKNQGIEYTINFKIPEEEKKNLEKSKNENKFWGYIAGGRKLLMKKEKAKAIKNYEAAYNIADNKYQKSRAKYEIANVYHMNKDYDKVIDICKKEVEREWQFPGMYGLLLSAFINKEGFDYEQKKKVFEQGIKSFGFKELYRVDDYLEHEMYFNFYSMMSSNAKNYRDFPSIIKYSKMAEIYLTPELEKNDKDWQN